MNLKVFSVYDGKASSFMRPFFEAHVANALRSFEEACKEASTPFYKYPQDFVLYQIGNFDDEQGLFETLKPPVQLAGALEFRSRHGVMEENCKVGSIGVTESSSKA